MLLEILKTAVSPITFAAVLRLSCPLVIGSMGGCFNEKTSTGNIAYECFMLTGCFFGAWGSYTFGSPLMGSLCAIASGLLLGAVYGLLVYHLNCNAMIVSVAYNNAAWALTTLLMVTTWGVRGNYTDPSIVSYETINLEFLKKFPLLDTLFNSAIPMVYLAYVIAIVAMIVMYKTPFGLRLRGVGINPAAAQSAGINVRKYRWICLLIMGSMMGLAGSYLPLSGSSMFTERMTDGRGFLCLTAILVGKADPFRTMLLAMLFAYSTSLTLVLSSFGLPSQILSMLPYLMVMVVLLVVGIRKYRGVDISGDMI